MSFVLFELKYQLVAYDNLQHKCKSKMIYILKRRRRSIKRQKFTFILLYVCCLIICLVGSKILNRSYSRACSLVLIHSLYLFAQFLWCIYSLRIYTNKLTVFKNNWYLNYCIFKEKLEAEVSMGLIHPLRSLG